MDLGKNVGEESLNGGAKMLEKSWGRNPISGGAKNFWGSAQTPLPTMVKINQMHTY